MSYFDCTENFDADVLRAYEEREEQETQKYKDKYNTVFLFLKSVYDFKKNAEPVIFEYKRMHDNLLQVVAVMKTKERVSFGFWHDKDTVDRLQRMFDTETWEPVIKAMEFSEALE